jgi:hypothetical protein
MGIMHWSEARVQRDGSTVYKCMMEQKLIYLYSRDANQ